MAEGRPLPPKLHPGAPVRHSLAAAEETEWRKWIPKVGDVVLVELANGQLWPGKVGSSKRADQGDGADLRSLSVNDSFKAEPPLEESTFIQSGSTTPTSSRK